MLCEFVDIFDGGLAALLAYLLVELPEDFIGSVTNVVFDFHAGRADEGIAEGGKEREER